MQISCTIRAKILLRAYDGWIDKNQSVLDVGCGNGTMAKIIQNRIGCRIEGTDIMNFLRFDIPFQMMKNDEELPYGDRSFDIVMLNDVLHHTKKAIRILKESIRVGKNVLIFETKPTLISKILDYVLNWAHLYSGMPIPLTHKTLDEWLEVFRDLGLNVEYREFHRAKAYPLTHYSFRIEPQ